jgi:hypothetical protein
MLKYTDITQNTYVQSWTVTEIITLTGVTHLLITKYILKVAGICGFSNVNNVCNIKLTCEWRDAIKLNYKKTRILSCSCSLGSKHYTWVMTQERRREKIWKLTFIARWSRVQPDNLPQLFRYSARNRHMNALFSGHYLRNRSTLDIGVLGYIGIF